MAADFDVPELSAMSFANAALCASCGSSVAHFGVTESVVVASDTADSPDGSPVLWDLLKGAEPEAALEAEPEAAEPVAALEAELEAALEAEPEMEPEEELSALASKARGAKAERLPAVFTPADACVALELSAGVAELVAVLDSGVTAALDLAEVGTFAVEADAAEADAGEADALVVAAAARELAPAAEAPAACDVAEARRELRVVAAGEPP